MKLTIDLAQSPQMLMTELTSAVRYALGPNYYIEQADDEAVTQAPNAAALQQNFTPAELKDPATNLAPVAAPAGNAPGGVAVDSNGDVWDARIHSAGKSTIANGTWKLKKGVDKDLVVTVLAQNKSLATTPLPATAPAAATADPAPIAPLNSLPPLATLPPVAAMPAAEIVVTDYPSFAQWFAQQLTLPTKDRATAFLDQGLTHYGIVENGQPHMAALAHRPDVIHPLYSWLKVQIPQPPQA